MVRGRRRAMFLKSREERVSRVVSTIKSYRKDKKNGTEKRPGVISDCGRISFRRVLGTEA